MGNTIVEYKLTLSACCVLASNTFIELSIQTAKNLFMSISCLSKANETTPWSRDFDQIWDPSQSNILKFPLLYPASIFGGVDWHRFPTDTLQHSCNHKKRIRDSSLREKLLLFLCYLKLKFQWTFNVSMRISPLHCIKDVPILVDQLECWFSRFKELHDNE